MGKNDTDNHVLQTINVGNAIFATPAFWQNNLYLAGTGKLQQFTFDTGTSLFSGAAVYGIRKLVRNPRSDAVCFRAGATNGIVWAITSNAYGADEQQCECRRAAGPAVLHAYPATSLTTELWNSSQATGDGTQPETP